MLKSEGARKYLANTSWMFVEKVVRLGVVMVTTIFTTRYLGDQLFGQLSYASGYVGLFFALTSMGLDEIVVRDLVRKPERRDDILGTAAMLKLFGALLLVVLTTAVGLLKGMDGETLILVAIIAVAELLKPFVVVEYWFQAQVQAKTSSIVLIAQALISAGYKFFLIGIEAPLSWFAWSYVVEMLVMSGGYLWAYERSGATWRTWKYSKDLLKELLQQSWPLIIFGIALYVQAKIDQVMIGDILTRTKGQAAAFKEVGQYSVALKMIEALGFLPVIVQKSLAPAITRAKLESREKYEDRLLNQYRLMFLMFVVTAVPLFFLARPVIVLFFGPEFEPAGVLLGWFSIRLLFTNMGMGKASFITNESLFKYSLITAVVGASLNIAINYLLIPTMGSFGSIWASVISFTVSLMLMDLLFKDTRANFGWMMKAMFSFWKFHRAT
ncbi:MAG: flippase [Flavobacteriales bacterium]|nr:MAG: flippase [Flavobacteriales bacterium]